MWELLVSIRYLLAKRREKFISVTTALSIISVTIGVAALIIVLSVMDGFGEELRKKIVGFNYHIYVEKYDGVENAASIVKNIKEDKRIVSASPFIDGQAIILTKRSAPRGVLVRGLEPSSEKNFIDIEMVEGSLDLKKNEIAVGNELASLLRVSPGDGVNMISGSIASPQKLKVAAIFHSGMYDYDANVAITGLDTAKVLFGTGKSVGGIGVRLKRLDDASSVKDSLASLLGRDFLINTWIELNKNLFAAIKMERILVFIVVTLTIAVGALNIINTLSLLTLEKTKDIGILRALGATRLSIAKIYILKGLIIGLVGSSAGLVTGLALTKNINEIANAISRVTGFELFSREIYYLDKIPTSISYSDVRLIIFFAVGLSFLAALYPAWHASRLNPVEALRYE